MPLRARPILRFHLLALSMALMLVLGPAIGQDSDNPLDALQMMQGLSPAQRDAISRQLGGSGGGLGATQGSLGGRQEQADEEQQNFMRQQQRDVLMDAQKQRAELERLSPFLQGEDWVVITIDSSPLPGGTQTPGTPPTSAEASAAQRALGNVLGNRAAAGALAAGAGKPDVAAGGTRQTPTQLPPQVAPMIELIRSKNPYQLSRDGVLALPGFAPIPLAGLTEQLATLRLGVEPALRDLFIRVTKLPLEKIGTTALKPFGYELFDRQISTFAPATDVPVPAHYIVGPGDELAVQLYGNKNANLRLIVGRNGLVNFPQIGPISVGGQTFEDVKAGVEARVERQMIGVRASVSMGETRSIRVFVLGDARRPGSYTISGLSTISSALFAAGGVQPIGSLRNIHLKRRGELVRQLDLYDMLIRGDTTDDAKLLPDDVIFVPSIGPTVTVDGEVHRPAIYEIRNESSVADVVQLAGGLPPKPTPRSSRSPASMPICVGWYFGST